VRVALYGAGQLAANAAAILARQGHEVLGPHGRDGRDAALRSGAEVVVVATTSFLAEVAPDIRLAVESGSNVIVSAEEAAFPWAVDAALADELDALARERGVTILGGGINPGFAFDALVITAAGPSAHVSSIKVQRIVDLSGFGTTVLRRIGVGHTPEEFAEGTRSGAITGHIGFPQSMRVVASALGVELDRVEREISPLYADGEQRSRHVTVPAGSTAGFEQRYLGIAGGELWFEALFTGHLDPASLGSPPRDEIWIEGEPPLHYEVVPGFNAQSGSSALVANSVRRVAAARPGWITVADLPPAAPRDVRPGPDPSRPQEPER
jgi:4-hydroxy-tetrahydrodipicolinate reductase